MLTVAPLIGKLPSIVDALGPQVLAEFGKFHVRIELRSAEVVVERHFAVMGARNGALKNNSWMALQNTVFALITPPPYQWTPGQRTSENKPPVCVRMSDIRKQTIRKTKQDPCSQ